jgi:hypothetical protein
MADFYMVHATNPNDKTGGGGCLATGGRKGEDCAGPWIEFHRVSTEFDASPYSVICAKHLAQVSRQFKKQEQTAPGDELARGGRVGTVTSGLVAA